MRVAVIDNGTIHPKKILALLEGSDVENFDLSESANVDTTVFDLLILSGSSRFPIAYNMEKLADEIDLIQRSTIPVLGICYGCELIAVAFGGSLKDMGDGTQKRDALQVTVNKDDPLFQGKKNFLVYDAHRWFIDSVPENIEVLATSEHGPEVIKHKDRAIYGFQFHPEKMLDETFGDELFKRFLELEVKK